MMGLRALILAAALWLGTGAQQLIQRDTEHGPIRGSVDTFSGVTVHRFLGVPFARPPVGSLRFLDPQAPQPWTEPRDTTAYTPYCAQSSFVPLVTSEDCLYLNVYAPEGATDLPVMVWIHGGGLTAGNAQMYNLETLASQGVVVVSVNYRVSVLGFLTTGDEVVDGNAGLKDQVMGLKWVKDNIRNFGGDPSKTTLFGVSAGSLCVNMHMVSPMSRGLFQRAISESGSVYTNNLVSKHARGEQTVTLASDLGCEDTNSSSKILECLQGKSTRELLSQERIYLTGLAAISGDKYLPNTPDSYWDNGDIAKADYMMGFNSEEASLNLAFLNPVQKNEALQNGIESTSPLFTGLTTMALNAIKAGALPVPGNKLWKLMSDQYFPDYSNKFKNLRGTLDMLSHATFIGRTMNNLKVMKEKAEHKTYLYYFDQVIEPISPLPFGHIATRLHITGAPELNLGAGHTSETAYAIGLISENLPEMPANVYDLVPEEDRRVGSAMMNAWVSFAKTGSPQFLASDDNSVIDWPEYDLDTQHYLEFKYPMSLDSVKERILPERVSLYTDVLPVYLESLEPPLPPSGTNNPEECEKSPSTLDPQTAETAFFILCAVVIVLLLVVFLVLYNYCIMKKQVKQLEAAKSKEFDGISNNIL